MKGKLKDRIISIILAFNLVFSNFIPFVALTRTVLAEDETPAPTEEVTPTPTEEVTPAPTEEITPTPTTEITQTEVATPTPTVEITPTVEETPIETITPTEVPTLDPAEATSVPSPPDEQGQILDGISTTATPTPTITLVQSEKEGELQATILQNVEAESIDLDNLNLDNVDPSNSATLSTDKTDYAPTDTVLISGSGFETNTTYTLVITSDDPPAVHFETSVTTDALGSFIYAYQLDGNYRPNYLVELKDMNRTVVASTTFLDHSSMTVNISGGSSTTNSLDVTLNISWSGSGGDPTQARYGNDTNGGNCNDLGSGSWTAWEAISDAGGNTATKAWALASGTSGTRKVCVETAHGSIGTPTGTQADNDSITYSELHTITTSVGGGGTVTPSGAVSVSDGTDQTFTITPNSIYIVSDVLVDGVSQGSINSYTFTNVTTDHTISASFDEGWAAPTGSTNNNSVTNANNAFSSDDTYAVFNNSNDSVDYTNFGLSIPSGATINGIEVAVEGNRTSGRSLDVSLSWNGSSNFTSFQNVSFTSDDSTKLVGGSSDMWDRTWSASEFSNSNFRVKADGASGSGNLNIDQIQVKVFYTADTTEPTTSYNSTPPAFTNDNTLDYTGTSTDDSGGIALVEYRVIDENGGGADIDWTAAIPSDGAYDNELSEDFSFITSALPDGLYTVETRGTDAAGNIESTATHTVTVDTAEPLLWDQTTFSGWYTSDQTSTFTYADSDSDISGSDNVSCDITTEGLNQTCSVDNPNICDNAGNCNITPVTSNGADIDKTNPSDPGTPTADVESPTNQTLITWSWDEANDLVSGVKEYLWNLWQDLVSVDNGSTSETQLALDLSSLGEGDFYLDIQAWDNANNFSNIINSLTTTVDTTPPTVTAAETVDSDGNGNLDGIKLTFSEDIDDAQLNPGADGWNVADPAGSESIGTGGTPNDNILLLSFGEGPTPDTGNKPTVTYTPSGGGDGSTKDLAGNELGDYSGTPDDKALPVLVSAITRDANGNGQIEGVELTFSEDIDDSLLGEGADGWDVDGYNGEVIGTGNTANNNILLLAFDESGSPDTGTTPGISYAEGGGDTSTHDLVGNELAGLSVTSTDGAAALSSISGPEEGFITNDPIEISGSSSDDDILGDGDTVDYVQLFYRESVSEGEENPWAEIDTLTNTLGDEPFSWSFTWTPSNDGTFDIKAEATDTAGNTESSPQVDNITYDVTAPTEPVADPGAGDYNSDQQVSLSSTGENAIYYTTDGSEPDNGSTVYTSPILIGQDTTLKAIAYDEAGNFSSVLTAEYGIAPVISSETSTLVGTTSTTITWTTDDPSTSRVIYDTVSHPVLGAAPNYDYANSTVEDSTLVTSHSVGVTGLTSGTTYYYRTVSHGSPETVSAENSFKTDTPNGGGGGGTVAGATAPVCSDAKPGSAPTLISAVAGINSVTLTWAKASDPVSYYLMTFGTSPGAQTYGNPNVGGSDATSYTVSGLSGGATYYFKVRAGNGCAPGDYSNELSATPTGGFIAGIPVGFAPGVLGATTTAEETAPEVINVSPSPTGSVLGQVKGVMTNKNNWKYLLLLIPIILLVLYFWRKRSAS